MTDAIIRDLGEGLVIRHPTAEDAEALAKFNKDIHSEDEWDARGLEDWTLDLISGEGPTVGVGDFTIVEDTRTGEIVSSCCLISQTWSYEGIPFKVGRPELVGTKKEFRQRGLVREQMGILHQWSEARGQLVQAITGIPYYYRQFGYEMVLNLGGGRTGYKTHVPKLKDDQAEPFTFREADKADIHFLMATYNRGCQRSMVYAVWNKHLWRYELTGKRKFNINRRDIFIIEDRDGQPAGFIGIPPLKWGDTSALTLYEISPGYTWSAVTPSVIRFLWETGKTLAKEQKQTQEKFGFFLGEVHPSYEVVTSSLPNIHKPYAYYLRVPDLVEFLHEVSPALETHLADTAFDLYSGKIVLSFYRSGLKLDFKQGHIEDIEPLGPDALDDAIAGFPGLTFLQLVFGFRSMEELKHAHPDCYSKNDENQHLLNALFPKKCSDVWPIS
ncbi:MAG: GNAT family N-acetyltransferase [Brevefilum sp.]